MYVSIRRAHGKPDRADEMAQIVEESWVPQISSMPGFIEYFTLDLGNGDYMTLSVFESQELAEESARLSRQWVGERLSDILDTPVEAKNGRVLVHKRK